MKTVGILTFYLNHNYGTTLQCYALKKSIENLGEFKVEIIPHTFVNEIENGFAGETLRNAYDKRIAAFDFFLKNIIGCTGSHISRITVQNCPIYDYYVVGSDTVWNTIQTKEDENYFLDFVEHDAVKIAYAPSLGVDNTSILNREIFEKYIDKFDYLSIREESDRAYVGQFTQKTIENVLDPTMLLEGSDYENLIEFRMEEKYILVYIIYDDSESVSYILNIANRIARKKSLKVVHFIYNIPYYIYGDKGNTFAFSTPNEFLGYVKNASLIITNSFHGTAFSILFRKPFYSFKRPNGSKKIEMLLNDLCLDDRLLYPTLDLSEIQFDIDYSGAEGALKNKRKQSIEYLKKALGII